MSKYYDDEDEEGYGLYLIPAESKFRTMEYLPSEHEHLPFIVLADPYLENKDKIFTFMCDLERIKVPEKSSFWRPNRFRIDRDNNTLRSAVLLTLSNMLHYYGINQGRNQGSFYDPYKKLETHLQWTFVMVHKQGNYVKYLPTNIILYNIHQYLKVETLR